MYTRWGRDVGDMPLDDYPRPQLRRPDWLNLNGYWSYAVTSLRDSLPASWAGRIKVPFCIESALSEVQRRIEPDERLWYRRTFALRPDTKQRYLLHFGAVDYACTIWVNGGLVGSHTGGFDPFSFDITDFLLDGDNEVVLAVADATSRSDQLRGKQHLTPQQIWYTPVTGIWQTVWLEWVPGEAHIDEVRLQPNETCDGVHVTVFTNRPSRDPALAALITVSLRGQTLQRTLVPLERRIFLPLADPELWSPEQPTLYDVEVQLVRTENPLPESNEDRRPAQLRRRVPLRGATEAGLYDDIKDSDHQQIDRVQCYFGLRRIEVLPHPESGHPLLYLNNTPRFHLGTLDQGWWPDGLHTPPSDEAMQYELEFLKAAGFNTLRKHIKIEPARYYYHCDRLGVLVWQDIPTGFLPAQFVAPNDEDEGQRSSRSTIQFETELQRFVTSLRGFPSIVMWVLHNEGWGQFDTARLCDRIRSLDSSSLVNATSGWLDVGAGDVIDIHDYDPEPAPAEADGRRALVIGEYGGIGWPVADHLWDPNTNNWGYQTLEENTEVQAAYARANAAIIEHATHAGLAAAIYTQTSDVEGEVNGLLTYDREVEKFPRAWLFDQHAPLTQRGEE